MQRIQFQLKKSQNRQFRSELIHLKITNFPLKRSHCIKYLPTFTICVSILHRIVSPILISLNKDSASLQALPVPPYSPLSACHESPFWVFPCEFSDCPPWGMDTYTGCISCPSLFTFIHMPYHELPLCALKIPLTCIYRLTILKTPHLEIIL